MSALLGIVENIGIRQQLLEVFSDEKNGTPDNISKFGCLALAKKGAVVWNVWRKAFPVIKHELIVGDFTNFADFRDLEIEFSNFAGFHFGDATNFTGTKFRGSANFIDAKFDRETTFDKAVFHNHVNFQRAEFFSVDFRQTKFSEVALFNEAKFSEVARFNEAKFTDGAKFIKTEFNEVSFEDAVFEATTVFWWAKFQEQSNFKKRSVSFCNATFNYVFFDNAQFIYEVDFKGTKFKKTASFDEATLGFSFNLIEIKFAGDVSFIGACFPPRTTFRDITFKGSANFIGIDINKLQDARTKEKLTQEKSLAPNDFQKIEFLGCKFEGEANFSNRIFKNSCTFGALQKRDKSDNLILQKTTFAKAPKFHNCELHQDTSFDGAEFPRATGNKESARAYRTLKLAFNKMQAVREEQLFFKLELAEEAKASSGLYKFLYHSYYVLSNFGFSVSKPLWWCLFSIIFFFFSYSIALHFAHCNSGLDCHFRTNWLSFNTIVLKFSLINALPLPGIEKIVDLKDCHLYASSGLIGWVITVLIFIQKLFSLVLLFLIGLGLKNLFKFK